MIFSDIYNPLFINVLDMIDRLRRVLDNRKTTRLELPS